MNRRYCLVQNGTIVKYNQSRKDFGVGLNSDEATCNDKGYYLVIDNVPTIDNTLQRISGSAYNIDEATKTVIKTYSVVDIPAEEIMANKAKQVETAVQNMLDNSSRSRGYDNIVSECSYATSTGAFGTEAQITVNWRDAVWQKVFEIQALPVEEQPTTIEDFMTLMPVR